MLNITILKQSFAYAALAILYVTLVATFLQNAEGLIGDQEDTILAPISFLLLLVVSAATMGVLIFGKPVMLYIDGKKKEGVMMIAGTIGFLAFFTALLLAVQSVF
jgi:hypothetical protein